jgi:aspartate aminotransferase
VENGFLPDPEQLDALIGSRTKAIFINTPGNPTGAVFPRALMEELVELANRRGVWLISDEVYDEMLLDDGLEHVAAATIDPTPVISVYSFSKVYAMTGWRLGYCVAPRAVADQLRKLQEPVCSCPSSVSQKAAEAALTGPREEIDAMRDAYRRRRDRAWETATEHGIEVFRTRGTFYMMLDVAAAGLAGMPLGRRLLDDFGVAIAPGVVFGPGGEGKVRVSFAVEPDVVAEGIRRLAAGVRALAAERTAA